MLKDVASVLAFIVGFSVTVPALPLALWLHGPQTTASLVVLLLSLPLYIWAGGYAYLRSFTAAEAGIVWLQQQALSRFRSKATAIASMWLASESGLVPAVQRRKGKNH